MVRTSFLGASDDLNTPSRHACVSRRSPRAGCGAQLHRASRARVDAVVCRLGGHGCSVAVESSSHATRTQAPIEVLDVSAKIQLGQSHHALHAKRLVLRRGRIRRRQWHGVSARRSGSAAQEAAGPLGGRLRTESLEGDMKASGQSALWRSGWRTTRRTLRCTHQLRLGFWQSVHSGGWATR